MKEIIKEIIREEMARDQKTYYFVSGLPRSGSTMLSAILNQNPRFYSGPNSPVTSLMLTIENSLSQDEMFQAYPKTQQAAELVANVIRHYYSDIDRPVIFDKNRSWVNRLHYVPGYFGFQPKVLVPVRNVDEIMASFISMHRRNGFEINGRVNFLDEMLIKAGLPLTDDNRCKWLLSPNGIVGQSYDGIKQALMQGRQNQLHFIEYDDLTSDPKSTMQKVYDFLGENYFEHDFGNLKNINPENDAAVYGFADMHHVRANIEKTSADPRDILSEEILQMCAKSEFWRDLQAVSTDVTDVPDTSTQPSDSVNQDHELDPAKIIGE
jgi:sulfotransferase